MLSGDGESTDDLPDYLDTVVTQVNGKRIFDLVVAMIFLIATLPLQFVILIGIFLTMGRPLLYLQRRPGRHGQPFTIIKFRTMTSGDSRDPHGAARVTRFGAWLRRTSLDELPEIINVIAGEMSIVGPRPLLVEYLPLYDAHQARRHEVRPGITGLAQVNGRNRLSWAEKFKHDVWYVDNQSFWLDLKIILLTVRKVFCTKEVNQDGLITMEPFRGNDG